MKRLIVLLAAGLSIAATKAPPVPLPPEGVQTAQPAAAGGYPYLLFLPRGYGADTARTWPVVIFLHGSGERGTDIELVKKNGPPHIIADHPGSPFLLVSPQLEDVPDNRWDTAKLDAMLAALRRQYRIDPSRIYLTGLSWADTAPGTGR